MKQEKLIGKFQYDGKQSDYTVKVKKRYQLWWWFLLLLIFVPLFIRCERTVTVKVVDADGNPVEKVDVDLSYTAYYFLADSEEISESGVTDSKGRVQFNNLSCSVYSYIFHRGEEMTVTANPPMPYIDMSETAKFHTTDEVKIVLDEVGVPVNVQVVDDMDGSPLVQAEVVVTRRGSGLGTFTTDYQGMVTIPDIKRSDKLSIAGRKYGYETNDTTLGSVTGRDLNVSPPRQIPLQKQFECDDDIDLSGGGEPETIIKGVDMKKTGGTFSVDFLTYSYPDRLIIYEEDGTQIFDSGVVLHDPSPYTYSGIKFKSRKLTFKVISDPQHPYDSVWKIHPHCPD